MSALTASSVVRESMGSLTLHIVTLSVTGTDTYASGLPNVIGYWANFDSASDVAMTVVSTGTTGNTFAFSYGSTSTAKLYIASKT